VGEYAAQVLLDYPSKAVKDSSNEALVQDLRLLLKAARPDIVYTHNLADKHDTHVGVALRVIEAIRGLPEAERPARLHAHAPLLPVHGFPSGLRIVRSSLRGWHSDGTTLR